MDTTSFEHQLTRDGYDDVSTAGFPIGHRLDSHAHPYDLRGLVTAGEFVIGTGGTDRSYLPGDVFELSRGTDHVERVGPDGVTFLIGRRHPTPTDG